jgi:hypothetical protein
MSIKVDLDALGATLGDYAFGYLVTVGDDYQAHAVTVTPTIGDGTVGVGTPGGRTRRNLAHHDGVTLLCPPRDPGGYTLIIDGRARTCTAENDELLIEPSHAVLHRRAVAPAAPETDGCGQDCVPLDES